MGVFSANHEGKKQKRLDVFIQTSRRFLYYECNSKMNRVPFLYSSSKRSVPFNL